MALVNFPVILKGFYKDEKGCWRRGQIQVALSQVRACWERKACRVHVGGGTTAACGTRYIKKEMERQGYFECHALFEQIYDSKRTGRFEKRG